MGSKKAKTFQVGDHVSWQSQAGGHWKQKIGTVVEVVPAFKIPRDKNFGSNRRHESYVVEVTYEPKRAAPNRKGREGVMQTKKPERYWPVVGNLKLVRRGSASATLDDVMTDVAHAQAGVPLPDPVPTGGRSIEDKVVDARTRSSQLSAAIESDAAAGGLHVDHLPVETIDGGGDLLWKDVKDAGRTAANANSESQN